MAYNILFTQVPKIYDSQRIQQICDRFDVEIHFFPFTLSKICSVEEFLQYSIKLSDYFYILFTSVESVEYFFEMKKKLNLKYGANYVDPLEEPRYICLSLVVQKHIYRYIGVRKSKVFMPRDATRKNTKHLFSRLRLKPILVPCSSEFPNNDIISILKESRCIFSLAPMYHVKFNPQLQDLPIHDYSVICFFTAVSVRAFMHYYPKYNFSKCYVGAYGNLSIASLNSYGIQEDFYAPTIEYFSLLDALYAFLRKNLPTKS